MADTIESTRAQVARYASTADASVSVGRTASSIATMSSPAKRSTIHTVSAYVTCLINQSRLVPLWTIGRRRVVLIDVGDLADQRVPLVLQERQQRLLLSTDEARRFLVRHLVIVRTGVRQGAQENDAGGSDGWR